MQFLRLLVLLWLTCFVKVGLLAQEVSPIHKTYIRKLFDEKNAWKSSAGFINDIAVTQDGKLWVGTNNSLICWNGNEQLIYDNSIGNPFQINGGVVKQIFEIGGEGLVLVTQEESLQVEWLGENKTAAKIINEDEKGMVIKGYLANVIQSVEGEIYAAYNEGSSLAVYSLDGNQFRLIQRFKFDVDISKDELKIAYYNQRVWAVIKGKGVWSWGNEQQQQVMNFEALSESLELEPQIFFTDRNDRLWLGLKGLDENLFLWEKNVFKPFETPLKYPTDGLQEDQLGNLLFVAGQYPLPIKEVYLLEDTSWLNYTPYVDSRMMDIRSNNDLSRSFFALTKDNIEQVEIKKAKVKNYLKRKEILRFGEIIKGIEEDRAGNVFILSEEGTFYKLDKQTKEIRKILIRDKDGNTIAVKCGGAMHRDRKGDLWFKVCDGNKKGILIHFEPVSETFEFYHHSDLIRDLDIDEQDQIWVTHHAYGDKKGKLSRFDIATATYEPIELQHTFSEPRYVYTENDSILWVGTLKGLVSVNTKRKLQYTYTTENSSLKSDHVIVIAKGPEDWLILGTFGSGLQFFNPKSNKVKHFNKQDGLVDEYVCGVISLDSNRYWLSTFGGLSYFDFNEQSFYNYDVSDGFTNNEFNRYSFLKTKDGTNYLGTVNGLNAFKTEDLAPTKSSGQIKLASIKKYYGKEDSLHVIRHGLDNFKHLEISPEETFVEFSFYSTDFTELGRSNFYTRLRPYDNDWVFAKDQKVRYRNLRPGKYELEVKGQYGSKFLKLEILSKPPIFKTWWFNLLILTLLTAIIAGIAKYRINKFKKEEEATREINRKFAALELQALQAQLNPHFIFNALGAIQHTIRDENPERAEHFLTSFALLMRLFLESSKKKNITLAEEIELITRYVELEQLRFENRFDFDFKIDEDINIHNTEIPSLLFQPFVENAINHGLFHKEGQGLLAISIKEQANVLHCEIIDDGVGRARTAEIQRKSLKSHKSRATEIVNERLDILQKVEGLNLTIRIEDLKPEGTKVMIEIPIENE